MRALCLITALLLVGATACQNAPNQQQTADSTAASMDHDMASMQSGTPLPEVPQGARVFFANLKDGQTVSSPFTVEMGVEGIALDSAGAVVAGSGHHHLLIDAGDSIPAGEVVPKDSAHLHFGNAQTETELTLPAGTHTLTLQFADGIHRSYGSALANSITVTVK